MKIFGHCCYFGDTGYAVHSRNFFKELSKLTNVKIRNFSIDANWRGINQENPYGDSAGEIEKKLIASQSYLENNNLYNKYVFDGADNFEPDYDIVLADCYHYYFYDEYKKKKIFYTAWEKTSYPDDFFQKLKEADQIWVPSKWQAEITIKQGIPSHKVKVVPEGIDPNVFFPENLKLNNKFSFLIIGKWEDRKSTLEIIKCFKELFGNDENFELIISCDSNFAGDQLKTTEERLKFYNIDSTNIKILHHLPFHDLLKILKSVNVFLSCSRSEGWNLPLIEAMACGIPSIYSNCSGQLEFASNRGIPVKIISEIKEVNSKNYGYYQPDYNDLKNKILEVYNSYIFYKNKALKESEEIRKIFTWENAAKIAFSYLNNFDNKITCKIVNESGSLGDFLAWTPVVARFAKEKNIEVDFYTPYKNILNSSYLNINFFDYNEKNSRKYDRIINLGFFNAKEEKKLSLQEVASDILNLEHKEQRCQISSKFKKQNNFKKKYVCIAVQSTCQCKYWNNKTGWQQVVDYLKSLGYEVVCIDRYSSFGIQSHMNLMPQNCIDKTGDLPLEDRINDLFYCDFFIGLSSGLAWLAWACNKPVVMISGFTDTFNEFDNPYRVINKNVCNSCWNDSELKFDAKNWLWCPRNKDFECSKEINFEMVKEKIDLLIKTLN